MPRRQASTLAELPAFVLGSASLNSIIMPSLGQARSQAKGGVCAGNPRQVGIGLDGDSGDLRDRLPCGSVMSSTRLAPVEADDPIHIADGPALYLGDRGGVFQCPKDLPDADRPEPFAPR